MVLPTMLRGGTNVILDHFDPESLLATVEREHVTNAFLSPTMIYMLLDHSHLADYDLSSLRCLLYGAAPTHVERLKEAMDAFGPCLKNGYGQMEAAMVICRLHQEEHIKEGPERLVRRLTSCGKPQTMVQIRIVDDDDNDVPLGKPGEIIVRGPHVMPGYWNREKETAAALRNGWLHTEDIGRMDEDGYIYIVDRKKDMIISGGLNVYPREVEDVLSEHPSVSQAAVIGIPDRKWGESVKAAVVLREGARLSEEEIIAFCKEHLTGYKCPKSVGFIDEMPLTAISKVDKKQLRASFTELPGQSSADD